jgi:hypothetical protein
MPAGTGAVGPLNSDQYIWSGSQSLAGRSTGEMGGSMSRVGNSRVWRLRSAFGLFVTSIALTACQHLGPWALGEGRDRYNEKIHVTSREQLFGNIIRVAYSENPLFMDVSEVDAAEFIQGTVSGGFTGLGTVSALLGAGPDIPTSATAGSLSSRVVTNRAGAAGGSFEYQESPTIRYLPLSGQALVAQIATPISVTSIANLISSDWPFISTLDLVFDRITPNWNDYYSALNAIASLYMDYNALVVAPTKSDATKPETPKPQRIDGTNFTIQTTAPVQQGTDSLTLYLQPDHPALPEKRVVENRKCIDGKAFPKNSDLSNDETHIKLLLAKRNIMHLWIRLLRLYAGTQADDIFWKTYPTPQKADKHLAEIDITVARLTNSQLDEIFGELPKKIELRSSAVPTRKAQSSSSKSTTGSRKTVPDSDAENVSPPNRAPIVQIHSALGILLGSLTQISGVRPLIEFVTPEVFDHIHQTQPADPDRQYYLLTVDQQRSVKDLPMTLYNALDPRDSVVSCVNNLIENTARGVRFPISFSVEEDVTEYEVVQAEYILGSLRRYMLIIVAPPGSDAPSDAFAMYTKRGRTFYIDGADTISQKNFALLSQFMTMQAVAPTTGPLTPTISVGAGG